jgi:hypothetical protein
MPKSEDIDEVIGPSAVRVVSDIAAQQWLNELKARQNPTPVELAMIEELDAAWRTAAAKDRR